MASLRGIRLGLLALVVAFAAGVAYAEADRVALTVTVTHLSKSPGAIDPKAADIHKRLRDEFRYESLRVLERRRMNLRLDEVGSLKLPTNRWVRVRPLHVGDRGVLIAVDVEGILQTDLRVENGRAVDIGAQSYEGGKLVVTLEPRY